MTIMLMLTMMMMMEHEDDNNDEADNDYNDDDDDSGYKVDILYGLKRLEYSVYIDYYKVLKIFWVIDIQQMGYKIALLPIVVSI